MDNHNPHENNLRKKLNAPVTPNDLASKIQSNWQLQLKHRGNTRGHTGKLIFASVASFLITMIVFSKMIYTPTVVSAALDDIVADAKQNIGIDISLAKISDNNEVPHLPEGLLVKMTKYCTLNQTKMLHMKVADTKRGEVHFFINKGAFDVHSWQSKDGIKNDMNWRIISPQKNLSVLVMYTPDMNSNSVNDLIQQLFYT